MAGVEAQGEPVLLDGVRHTPLALQRRAEIEVQIRTIRIDPDRLPELFGGFIDPALSRERRAELVASDDIVRSGSRISRGTGHSRIEGA